IEGRIATLLKDTSISNGRHDDHLRRDHCFWPHSWNKSTHPHSYCHSCTRLCGNR
ncbi:hypothetical protein BS47DRAFT_1344809, partial [Hydnum rufescens UP504]